MGCGPCAPHNTAPAGAASAWELCSASLTLYACWWLVYTPWLLIIGHALPERGWGRSSFADHRGTIARKFGVGDDRPRTQALVYCLLHAAVCGVLMTTVPLLLYRSCERAPPCCCALQPIDSHGACCRRGPRE